jgi:DNA replication protein DnaC
MIPESKIKEAQEQLEAVGYAANPFCTRCGGNGYLHPLDERTGRSVYSKVISCYAPGCLAESYKKYQAGEKGLLAHGLTTWAHTFVNFKSRPGVEQALANFKYLADGDTQLPFLFCYGGTGNGKSHLSEAATIRLMQRGIDTWYYTLTGLMGLLKRCMEDNTVEKTTESLQKVAGLVLDDWGELSDWEEQKLADIIDERYRWHRMTILTSNRPLERLMERNERVISRFRDTEFSVMVLNEATDYRPQKGG